MKQINFKKLLPHGVAIIVFLIVTVIFCKPALESGVIVQQGDVTAVESMKHQSEQYREKHGVHPLWITSMFSGMPAYNIIFDGPKSPIGFINSAFQLWLPKPLNFFFLSCICFYIFCLCLRIRPYLGIFASLGFAFATYNPILVVAGHDTKLLAMAYAPALIGSIILLFEKKYITGTVLTILFASLHLYQNHQQISYYLFLIISIMVVFYLVRWIKDKQIGSGIKSVSLAIVAAVIAVMTSAILIFPVYDFAKDSKRGGQLVMDKKDNKSGDRVEKDKTKGLSRDYAFQWSNDKTESLSILFPGVTGYGSYFSQRDGEYNIFPKLGEKSHVTSYLTEKLNLPEDQAANFAANLSSRIYWGGKPFTTGPAYQGAVICILFILGMFVLDGKHKWWILTASLLGIILAMGKYFPLLNNFFFDYLPFYNKLRTPEMALVIPQILFPMIAVMGIDKLMDMDKELAVKKLKMAGIAMGAVFVLAAGVYFTSDYSKENKQRTAAISAAFAMQDSTLNSKLQQINQQYEADTDNRIYEEFLYQSKGDAGVAKGLLNALREDRKSFYGGDILRALLFTLLTLAVIGLFVYRKVNSGIMLVALPLIVAIDLLPFGMNYLNQKSFETVDQYKANEFSPSEADELIMKDKDPNFRVFDLTGGDPFQDAKPSYFHRSIGGYHPAKLGIYDDLATYQLSGQPNASVLNMLNTRYIIRRGDNNKNVVIPNTQAMGPCWFVKGVKYVNGPVEEMKALDDFDPADTAVVDQAFKNIIGGFSPADSAASLKQTSVDNMEIKYESNSNAANLAVFSEIFYKDWNAYIDGKQVPVAKANYVLRALVIPAGKHTIDFKFEPRVFNTSYKISAISGWLTLLILLAYLVYYYKKNGAVE